MAGLLGLNTVQQVRRFLADQGLPQEPWSGASEVLGALERLMAARAEDPAFWVPLKGLLESLQAHARSMDCPYLPCPEAEILKAACLDEVIADLKAALPGRAEDQPHVALTRLAAPSLCCVLLLAMAAGCDGSPFGDSGPCGDGECVRTYTMDPVYHGPIEADLTAYVQDSDLDDEYKGRLLACLSGFPVSDRQDMVALFQNKTPAEISQYLQDLAYSATCNPTGETCRPCGALYKGISFPAGPKRTRA
jgi:hypothetical protein